MSANDLIDWIAYHANKQDRDWEYLRKELLRKVSQPSPSGDADYEKDARKLAKKLFPMYCEHFNGAYCDACAPMVIADALRSHDAKVSGQSEQRLEPIATTLKAIALYQERSPEANRLPVSIFSLVLNAQQILAEVRNERNTDSETVRDLRGMEEQQ